MIRAYDDYGNVVDLVEWEKQIRAEAIDECKMALLKAFDETNINEYGFYPQNVVNSVAGQLKEQE